MQTDYVLITSAYNEELYIGKTIESVNNQTIKPAKWFIISDCSSDGTDDILKKKAQEYSYIEYMRRDDAEKTKHDFASKVHALNTVLDSLNINDYSYIGILDADILIPENYYESLIQKFSSDDKLGLIGGSVYEIINGEEKLHEISLNTVGGAVQFFRIECFRFLGKFIPMPYGGEDSMMCVKAGYNGWQVKTCKDLKTYEQKFVGRSKKNLTEARYHRGKGFYDMGYHPLFMIFKCLYRTFDKPFVIGSIAEFWGFIFSSLIGRKRPVSIELIHYLRKEQMKRLIRFKAYR